MASAHYLPNKRFNKGNVDFELIVKNCTRLMKIGFIQIEKKTYEIKKVKISNLENTKEVICKFIIILDNLASSLMLSNLNLFLFSGLKEAHAK